MATAPDQGIMALPPAEQAPMPSQMGQGPQAPTMSLDESYGAMQQGLKNASPDTSSAVNSTLSSIVPMLDQLDDKMLDALLQVVQYLKDHEQEYPQLVAQIEQEGGGLAGIFPPEYDPEFLGTLAAILMHAKQSRGQGQEAAPEMAPPPGMARGGIAEAARTVARQGRGNDTMLAHITPREANLLRAHGGMGTVNPSTGVLEFDFWDDLRKPFKAVGDVIGDIIKPVVNVVKEVVSSPIGKIVATIGLGMLLGPGGMGIASSMWAPALASGAITLVSGGSLTDALISGATAYFGAPGGIVSEFVGNFGGGIAGAAMNAAVSAGLTGVAGGLLSGKSFEDSVKNGLISGAIGGGMATLPSLTGIGRAPGEGISLAEEAGAAVPTPGSNGATLAETGNLALDAGKVAAPTDVNSLQVQGNEVLGGNIANAPPQFSEALNNPPETDAFKMPTRPGQDVSGETTQTGVAKPYAAPGIGESAGKMFEGATSGDFDTFKQGVSDLFSPGMDAAQKDAAIQSYMDKGMSYTEAAKRIADQSPGMFRTYGPLAAAGLAGLALTGGFEQKPAQVSPEQQAMSDDLARQRADIKANPGKYIVQGLPGVTYNADGTISKGQQSFNTMPSPGSTEVAATPYVPYTPSTYTVPENAIGGARKISQPYNTASMYTNLIPAPMQLPQMQLPPPMRMPVRRAAMGGGIGSLATGGYPRKTGAIAGPGTATSDSIPAMLSDGEFVMTAKAVRGAGKGSKLAGAKKMYALMHQLERNASRS